MFVSYRLGRGVTIFFKNKKEDNVELTKNPSIFMYKAKVNNVDDR